MVLLNMMISRMPVCFKNYICRGYWRRWGSTRCLCRSCFGRCDIRWWRNCCGRIGSLPLGVEWSRVGWLLLRRRRRWSRRRIRICWPWREGPIFPTRWPFWWWWWRWVKNLYFSRSTCFVAALNHAVHALRAILVPAELVGMQVGVFFEAFEEGLLVGLWGID